MRELPALISNAAAILDTCYSLQMIDTPSRAPSEFRKSSCFRFRLAELLGSCDQA